MPTKFRIYIITEGGKDIGFGHIARCISLYDAFLLKGQDPLLILNGDKSVDRIVEGRDYIPLNWLKKKTEFFNIIQYGDIGVIDSYLAPLPFYERFEKTVRLPIYIDDNNRIDYPRGIIINGSIYAKEIDYPVKSKSIYLLGPEYALLRKDFWETEEKNIKKEVEEILITFGGDDIRNLTPFVLKILEEEVPHLKKKVVISGGFRNIEYTEKYKNSKVEFLYSPSSREMKELMYRADIAISAGGQTIYELARVGVPSIIIGVADNQTNNILAWKKKGFIKYAGWWNDKDLRENLLKSLKELFSYDLRKKISNIGRSLIDGKGALRVIDFILKEKEKL